MKNTYVIGRKVRFILSEKSLERISDGTKISLRTPASFCLKLLLENQGKLVTHDELYYSGWQCFGMTASLSVLHNTIYYLRKNLNEIGGFDNKIIETINRRGFVFSLKVNVYSAMFDPENTDVQDYLSESMQNNPDSMNSGKTFTEKSIYQIPSLKDKSTIDEKTLDTNNIDKHELPNEVRWLETSSSKEKNEKKLIKPAYISKIKSRINLFTFISLNKKITITKFVFFWLWLAALYFISNLFMTDSFPSSYSYKGKLEGCDVYQNNSSYDFNNLKLVDYLRNYCKSERSLYITYYPYTNKLSTINCRKKITFISNDICFSNYFIFNNNGLKNV